jgi:SAM-dependent methyltransferase
MLGRLVWPVPALLGWALAWGVFALGLALAWEAFICLAAATSVGVVMSVLGQTWWRRLMIGAGFPLSIAMSGALTLPAWMWLIPLGLLLLVYPINAWRDAPLFPTPSDALLDLPSFAPLPPRAHILDAGCGLGHGLVALRAAYPLAKLQGVERSYLLRLWCALQCPWAQVQQGDMWAGDWSQFDLVYLFQRPESMADAALKASRELRPGAWLVSLEFEALLLKPSAQTRAPGGKMVWLYQAPLTLLPPSQQPPGD